MPSGEKLRVMGAIAILFLSDKSFKLKGLKSEFTFLLIQVSFN
jgi:hypothetical protein